MSLRRICATLVLAVVLAGCVTGGATPPPTADPPSQDGADAPMPEVPALVADWERDDVAVELPGGWVVQGCEGDAPLLCVTDGDRQVGFLELGRYPLPDDHEGDDRAYLAAAMDSYVEGMRADRAQGCPDLTFEPIPAIDRLVGGEPGLRGGYRLVNGEGREVERHVQYWTVVGGDHVSVTVPAYAADGCLEAMGEFSPEDLGLVALHLDRLVGDTPLPPAADAA